MNVVLHKSMSEMKVVVVEDEVDLLRAFAMSESLRMHLPDDGGDNCRAPIAETRMQGSCFSPAGWAVSVDFISIANLMI